MSVRFDASKRVAAFFTVVMLLSACSSGGDADARATIPSAAPSVTGELLADQTGVLHASEGGTVTADDGSAAITVPPGVMQRDGHVHVRRYSRGVYDIHVDVPWEGTVDISMPAVNGMPIIAHRVDGVWRIEQARLRDGRAVTTVRSLSLFSDLRGCWKALVAGSPQGAASKVVKCLARIGVKKLPEFLGKKLVGHFNEYDACKPVSTTNWSIDWLEIMLEPCSLSEPSVPDEPDAVQQQPQKQQPGGGGPPTKREPVPPPAAPAHGRIELSRGGSAPQGSWYAVTLTGFAAGASVTVTCRDSADPGGFWNQNFVIGGDGRASDSTLCYSADGPDHWVTAGGIESNHVGW